MKLFVKMTYISDLVLSYLAYIILILGYVKIVLNEMKVPDPETLPLADAVESDADSESTSKKKKPSKLEMIAKAFFLDAVFNTAMLVIKDRKDMRRPIIILFLVINIVANLWPYQRGLEQLT